MNKLKIGDKVQLKAKSHTWHTENINMVFLKPSSSEFEKENYEEIALLLLSKARRAKLKGKVLNYGATDGDYKDGRQYVRVEFSYKGMKTDFYCSENELKRI